MIKHCEDPLKYFTPDQTKYIEMNTQLSKLYGLQKIHKNDIPIRPVNSFYEAPTKLVTKWLNKLIKNIINIRATYGVNNL